MKTFITLTLLLTMMSVRAEIPAERYGQLTIEKLPPHALLVNNFSQSAGLYDTDTGKMLGMISTGIGANAFEIDHEKGLLHTAETYLSRHTRGERTDVISTYDLRTLSPQREIVLPPKHASGAPIRHYSGIIRQDAAELMLVVNITPAVSVSVADLNKGIFLTEIATAGCGLVYPVEGLRFLQLCGDGRAQLIVLDENGQELSRTQSESFFNLDDPLIEKAVQTPSGWLYSTYSGKVFIVSTSGETIKVAPILQLGDNTSPQTAGEWRIGGMQPLAYYAADNLLLVLMHEGGQDTHKNPGTEIWYYKLDERRLAHRLVLNRAASSIQVSQDGDPRLFAASIETDSIDIYDLVTTRITGEINELGMPTLLQNLVSQNIVSQKPVADPLN